jgi:hypothetical protein
MTAKVTGKSGAKGGTGGRDGSLGEGSGTGGYIPIRPQPEPEPKGGYVTQEQLEKFGDGLMGAIEALGKRMATPSTPAEVKQEVAISAASTDSHMPVPPKWEEKARELLGDALDHCELAMPARGGTHFTLVIKNEHSNAPKDYLERYKADRRTREIGNEGMGGVEEWCKLVALNLKKK